MNSIWRFPKGLNINLILIFCGKQCNKYFSKTFLLTEDERVETLLLPVNIMWLVWSWDKIVVLSENKLLCYCKI